MAQQLAELCTLLVDDLYGELSSQVFSVLIQLGRASLVGLAKNSSLSLRQIKNGLAVLVQQNLALHYTSDGDDTYYEANEQYAYSLVRAGKIVQALEDRYGEEAGDLASNLIILGHTKVEDLADAYGLHKKRRVDLEDDLEHVNRNGNTNGMANGDSHHGRKSHIQTIPQLHAKLRQLLAAGYLIPVHKQHFLPAGDIKNEASLELMRLKYSEGARGPKKQAQFQVDIKEMLAKWRDERTEEWRSYTSLKRGYGSNTYNGSVRKRRKLNGNHANGVASESDMSGSDDEPRGAVLDGELVVRINYEKCDVALRSQLLVAFAAKYLGETTAKVYEAFLKCLEERIPRCYDEYATFESNDEEVLQSPAATNGAILSNLDPSLDLSQGIPNLYMEETNGVTGKNESDSDDENHVAVQRPAMTEAQRRAHLVDTHMHLLAVDPRKFARSIGSRGGGEWKADFRHLSGLLLQDHLTSTVDAKFGDFGPKAAKIMRILFEKGKLDEKQVAHLAMMRQKDMRGFLTHLQEAGYVDCQEIPKDNSRMVNKTMFFWFFDQDRCRRLLLADSYKAMGRILWRIKVERGFVQPVIDKAERLDVVGREDELLSHIEKEALKDWTEAEGKLLAQLSRLDNTVGVLRDFYIPPIP